LAWSCRCMTVRLVESCGRRRVDPPDSPTMCQVCVHLIGNERVRKQDMSNKLSGPARNMSPDRRSRGWPAEAVIAWPAPATAVIGGGV
jgi:hypothetical protein